MSGKIGSVIKENIGGLIFSVVLAVLSIIVSASTLEYGVGKFIALSIVFIPVVFIAWVIGNAIRKAVHPDFVVTSGFWGLVKEKIFWRVGPQAILALIVFAVLTNIAEGSSNRRDIRADRAANPSAVANASGNNNAATAPQFLELSKEEFIRMVAGDNQFEEVDVSRLATMIRRGSQYLRVTGTITNEVVEAIGSFSDEDTTTVLDLSAVQGWQGNSGWMLFVNRFFSRAEAIILGDSFTRIPENLFDGHNYNTTVLKAVFLPNSITAIGNEAFANSRITEIVIPPSVVEIGDNAFRNCTELRYVYFSENSRLATIGLYAFSGCEALYSISIPASLKVIGGLAFGEYDKPSGLQTINIPANSQLEEVQTEALAYTGITSFTFPSTIKEIGAGVLGEQAVSVVIHATVPPNVQGDSSYTKTFPRTIQAIYVPAESLSAYEDAWFDYEFTFDGQLQAIK